MCFRNAHACVKNVCYLVIAADKAVLSTKYVFVFFCFVFFVCLFCFVAVVVVVVAVVVVVGVKNMFPVQIKSATWRRF